MYLDGNVDNRKGIKSQGLTKQSDLEMKSLNFSTTKQQYKFACKGSQAPAKLPITMDISLTAIFLLANASILLPEARSWELCYFRLIERNHITTKNCKCLNFHSYTIQSNLFLLLSMLPIHCSWTVHVALLNLLSVRNG